MVVLTENIILPRRSLMFVLIGRHEDRDDGNVVRANWHLLADRRSTG